MANTEAKLDFSANTAEAEKNIAKLTKENAKLRESMRQIAVQSKDGSHDKFIEKMVAGGKATSTATGQLIGLASRMSAIAGPAAVAATGVGLITRELQKFNDQQAEAVRGHREFQAELAKTISTGKDSGIGPRVEAFTRTTSGATREDALKSLQSVSGEMQTSSFERRADIARSVARLGITGRDVSQTGGMAGFLGQDVLTNYKGQDVADVAALLQKEAGGDFEKIGADTTKRAIQQLVSSGAMTPEEAVGTALAAARGDISGKTLTQIAKTAAASKESIGGIGESGNVGSAKRRLGKMSPRERIAGMLSDKSLAEAGLGENAIELDKSRLSMAEITANAALISGVQSRDVIGEQRQSLAGSSAGRAVAARYQTQVTRQTNEELMTRRNELLSTLDDQARSRVAGKGFIPFAAAEVGVAVRQSATLMGFGPDASKESVMALEGLVDLSRRQLRAMEEQSKRKTNVDAHTE